MAHSVGPLKASPRLVGTGERQARRIVSALCKQCVLLSESPRTPFRLAFPATLAERWMPGLFQKKQGRRVELNPVAYACRKSCRSPDTAQHRCPSALWS
jgi:hypothetical protein